MTHDPTYEAEARALAAAAPGALRSQTRAMLADMDLADPGRPQLAPDRDAEVEAVIAHANATSWRFALVHAAADLLGVGPDEGAEHPAVALAEQKLADPELAAGRASGRRRRLRIRRRRVSRLDVVNG